MRRSLLLAAILLSSIATCFARDVRVAADGTGDFTTVQAAVDSIPENNTQRVVIAIKNGTYTEQVRIRTPFITLRGQDRKLTKITSYDNTSACPVQPGQSAEEQCATVVADATDIVVENLTIENSYKGPKGKAAALSFMGDSTRIAISKVDIVGFGGNTLGLTAHRNLLGDGGEYYLNDVYVSGLWHIIVPRGNAYVTNSNFVCLGENMYCLFAEGITRERDKLVIVNSTIESAKPFKLGSYFRDAAWYFVDVTFPPTLMPDGQIYHDANKAYRMKWGEGRVFFAGAKGPNYSWLKDNIERSPARTRENVTAAWALPDWNPESTVAPTIKSIDPHPPLTTRDPAPDAEIKVIFSESVTVRGMPVLKFGACRMEYLYGSGTDTITFLSDNGKGCTRLNSGVFQMRDGAIFASAASLTERNADLTLPK